MASVLINLFDAHRALLGNFNHTDPNIVVFLKRVADNAGFHYSAAYKYPLDEDIVEEFIARNSKADPDNARKLASIVRGQVAKLMEGGKDVKYFDIQCVYGDIVIDFTAPEVVVPTKLMVNYDVPWHAPRGTVNMGHLDSLPSGICKYIWCDDNRECDIIIGSDLFIIKYGLWELRDGKLIERKLEDFANEPKQRMPSNHFVSTPDKPNTSLDVDELLPVEIDTIRKDKTIHVVIDRSGDYGEPDYDNFMVYIGSKPESPKEYDVRINGVTHLVTKSGPHKLIDGELKEVV